MKSHPRLPSSARFACALLLAPAVFAQTPSAAEQAAGLIRKNDLAAAEAVLTAATTGDSRDAAAFFQLGTLRLRQQRADDAVTAFEKATQLDATKPEYFSQYAIALGAKMPGANLMTQATLAPKMKRAFEQSLALDPHHLAGLIGLARYYSNAPEIAGGSPDKAREFARRIHTLQPFLGELELGTIAEREEEFSVALAHFDAASKLQPGHAGAHASAGRMLARLGRHAEARLRLERALEIDPKRDSIRQALDALPR